MLSPAITTCGAIAFILGRYLYGGVHWRQTGAWLSGLGIFVLLLALYHVWTPMDRAFSTEPLFIGFWIALPILWYYRECGMLVPLQESLAAFGWSLIAILVGSLALSRVPEPFINAFATILVPSAAEPTAILILAITLPTVFLAALEADSNLKSPHSPYIFALAFAVFSVGLTSLLGNPFPAKMVVADFLLLSTALLTVVRLRVAIHTAWARVLVELLLWFVLIAVILIITRGHT